MSDNYVKLGQLLPYKLAVNLSRKSWTIYSEMDWNVRKIIGNQFISAMDSIGANIAEGYGRFHYRDRIKFYYNARGSYMETKHWLLMMRDRKIISTELFDEMLELSDNLGKQINIFIKSCYRNIDK